MKINFVSFSDYASQIEVYNLEKMDLFVFLLVKIIEKGSSKTIKDVLLDLDVTDALLYLYQNNFYYLLDNDLIINNSNSEDISEIVVDDLAFSDFGRYCLSINKIPKLEKSESKRVIYNPLKKELVSDNKLNDNSNVVIFNNNVNYLNLINDYKKQIFSRYEDDFILNFKKLAANPYYFSIESSKIDDSIKESLKANCLILDDDKNLDENKKVFMSSNFKINLFYGEDKNTVSSDYYLIVDEGKKFTVSGNKVYIGNVVNEYLEYSFVEIGKEVRGYNIGKIMIDDIEGSCFESFKLKDYKSDVKKYLLKNRDKYKDGRIVNKIIDLL